MIFRLNLQQFAEGEGAAAPAAAGAETATAAGPEVPAAPAEQAPITAGKQLADGQTVKNAQVAAALEKQMRRHPELRNVYGKGQPGGTAAPQAEAGAPSIEERWAEAKKGEFAELYGRDVQAAIRDRFKNNAEVSGQLEKLEPMLKVLRDRAGVETNDDLIKQVMDDDSLYEEAANEAGMTTEAYKTFKRMEAKLQETERRDAENLRQQRLASHFMGLQKQAESLRQIYPGFDLKAELQNPTFMRLTSPEIGISVEDAYYAVHHKELAPQMMAYGMQRAKEQMGQTIQAQRNRPAEGAMKAQGQPAAAVRVDPRNMTKQERAEIKRQVRLGRRVSFD